MGLASGSKLGAYEIRSPLGAGGMGEVYRATDTKLGRDVALKVLPAEMALDPERLARFRREARAVAALNHPNVVTLYSVEERDGIHFLTMELVEGVSLDRRIGSGGLPVDQIVEIAGALAEALAAAHEKGIVHRDLKPANVMITNEGRVKVLDFGLAKDVSSESSDSATLTSAGHTQAGIVMGTPAYMSPEQVSGRPLDHRTDIFSLGVMLHELSTGARPFVGSSSAELVSAILRDTPPLVTEVRSELPADLARVIRRCLEKDPRYRVQTARDVSNEFRELTRLASRATPVSASISRSTAVPDSGAARVDEGFWVAVLPFKYSGSNADAIALAEGLTDDIVTGLSKFSYLRVIARSSTARYAQQAVDVRTAAKDLGARYVMEGSVRQAGVKVRVAVQLVDSNTGAGLWAETYDRAFAAESTLDLLDDVVPRIVATVGDTQGILPHSMTESLRGRDPESLTPYEALLRSFGFHQHVNAEEHLAGRTALEHAVKSNPDRAELWAMLSWLYRAEYTHEYNERPDALDRCLSAAQRAVSLEPSNQLAQASLASAFFFRRELGAFRAAAERALALNQMEGYTTAFLGHLFACSGDWERGCALTERAIQLNPNHPGWYWLPLLYNAYRLGDGQRALEFALRINMPRFWTAQLMLAVLHSHVGEMDQARIALRELLALRPRLATGARKELEKWWRPDLIDLMLADLQKAGLEMSSERLESGAIKSSASFSTKTVSGETRAEEGFWVTVLPFRHKGRDEALVSLADGLTEEIITGLSRFSYLRVISRSSTARYSTESGDVRAIGKEVGARYVLEGSIRQAGPTIRLAVQLVDAITGAHLWAETFEHSFRPDEIFSLQDQLVPRIVSTVADQHGILPRSISAAIRKKSDDQLTPYEAVFRVFSLHEKMTVQEHAACRSLLERVVRDSPDSADCWAVLATLYGDEDWFGFNLQPDPLGRAFAAAQRASALAPTSSLAGLALAQSLFQRHEWQAFRPQAERTIALNPMDGATLAVLAIMLACTGDWEKGCSVVDSAMRLHPNFPGWYWLTRVFDAYRTRDYRATIDAALRIQMPGYFWTAVACSAAYGQLNEREAAQKSLRELLASKPNFAATARQELEKWFAPELVEHFLEGLTKAGLASGNQNSMPVPSSTRFVSDTDSSATRSAEGFWVAVLPFKYTGSNQDFKSLAEGLSEEIVTGLSRFSYLRVIARGSSARYSRESDDVRAVGKELGARYVMEGSIRQAGSRLRLAVQLIETSTGSNLWAETFERIFSAENLFELQDELVPRIVATVADTQGIIMRSMVEELRTKPVEQLTAYEALVRSAGFSYRLYPEEHAGARACAERAVQLAPNSSQAWASLAQIYAAEYGHFFNPQPQPLERALKAARRAVDCDVSNAGAHSSLAYSLFLRKEYQAFRIAAEQALELNPCAAGESAVLGLCLAYTGDWEHGCAVVDRAIEILPRHPGWYLFPAFYNAYRKRDYQEAIRIGLKLNLPNLPAAHAAMAAAYGQAGDRQAAHKELQELRRLMPSTEDVLERTRRWHLPEMVEHIVDGLRKAGLEIPDSRKQPVSGAVPVVAPSIAVLPFANMSDDKEQDYFSDGLAEEIINLLAQVPGLKVIARTSAFAFRGKEQDIRGIAETLGVSTVLEGSVRRSGNRIRVTAQLINAADGSHLWSERYDRELSDIFAVQDEISAAIAKALRVKLSPEATPPRYTPKLESYEAYLKARYHQAKVTPDSMELARRFYEQAAQLDPGFAMPHVGLGFYWHSLAHFGRHFAHDCVAPARAEAQKALQIDPSLPEAHAFLGYLAAMYDLDWAAAEKHFESPVAKQVGFGLLRPLYGWVLFWQGEVEQAIKLANRAIEEDPLEVWARMNLHAYLQAVGRDNEALDQLKKVLELDENLVLAHVSMAMIYADKGDMTEALKIARRAYAIGPWSPDPIGVLAGLTKRSGNEVEPALMKALGSGEAPGDARALALYHLLCGEIDPGAHWTEKAIEQRDASMMVYLRFVVCKNLRASHRWTKIAKMINLPS